MKYSVIIPVYNVAPYLMECLDSVRMAIRGMDVEVLCIDDGSTDGSSRIMDEFARENPAFICMHQENSGVAAARNAGLERACGDWILFVDSDDVVRETWLQDVDRVVTECPTAELVSFGLSLYGDSLQWHDADFSFQEIDLRQEIPNCLAGFSFCLIAYRRDIVESVRFRPFSRGEDLVFACEAITRANRSVSLLREEYGYRLRMDSATHAEWTTKSVIDTISFCPVMFGILAQSGKRIGERFVEGRGDEWLFRIPLMLWWLRNRVDGPLVWKTWFESVKTVRCLPIMDRCHRLVAVVAELRIRWLVLLICRIVLKIRHWERKGQAIG